jgi:hypothetical protein
VILRDLLNADGESANEDGDVDDGDRGDEEDEDKEDEEDNDIREDERCMNRPSQEGSREEYGPSIMLLWYATDRAVKSAGTFLFYLLFWFGYNSVRFSGCGTHLLRMATLEMRFRRQNLRTEKFYVTQLICRISIAKRDYVVFLQFTSSRNIH